MVNAILLVVPTTVLESLEVDKHAGRLALF